MINVSELIKQNIEQTAERLSGYEVTTQEDMIPRMDLAGYTNYYLDVEYGSRTNCEKMDLFYPKEGEEPYPVFIEVHGGAWYFGQKCSIEFEPFLYGRERGYVCASLGYTLSPQGHYPLPVQEIKGAIRYLRKNADTLRIDPERIVLWGGSAGAHLAALAANSCDTGYLEEDIFGYGGVSAKPNALVLWYGCFDYFHNGRLLDEWIYQNFFGVENLDSIKNTLEMSSPLQHITDKAAPTFLQHGRTDSVVPCAQSEAYYRLLSGKIEQCRLDIVEECDHADAKLFAKDNIMKVFDFADMVFDFFCRQKDAK